jgi:hypothetical protein
VESSGIEVLWYGEGFAEENKRTRGKKEKMGGAEG